MKPKVTLLIPTLNEIEGMRVIMPQISSDWCEQILFVDGGSKDGTIEYIKEHGYDLVIQNKRGIRNAYMEALPMVKGDYILTFSPDGNSKVDAIPALIAKVQEGFDMVIASRYLPPAKSQDDDLLTAFGNWLFTRTINLLHAARYTDAMVILRIYKKSLISELDLDKDQSYCFEEKLFRTIVSWEPLLSVRAAKRKLKVAEIPAEEPPRIGGERKLQVLKWGAAYYFQFLREVFIWK